MRPSISLRIDSIETCARGKKRPVKRLVFAHQAQQQMFGLNCRRAKLRRFVTSEENYPARFFGVAFEHSFYSSNSPL